MNYSEIETSLYIGDQQIPATFSFDYQPSEAATRNYPGCAEEITITGCLIEPDRGNVLDLFKPEFKWLATIDVIEALQEDASAYIEAETKKYTAEEI